MVEDLRLFIEYAPVAIAMLDRDMRYLAASRRWRVDYRLPDTDLRGRSHYELFPEVPEHWKAAHVRCLAGAAEESDGELFVRADGTRQWIRWAIQPWRTASGDVGGMVIFAEDITGRTDAETALTASRQQHRESAETAELLFETAAQGIVTVDADGTILSANAAVGSMFGWKSAELVGQRVERLLPSFLRDRHERHRADYLVAPHARPMGLGFDLIAQRKDGVTFPVEVSLNHATTSEGRRVIAFVTDISARKRSEDALREQRDTLARHTRELERRADQLRRLASDLTLAEQRAREQLAKTLHDHLQQLLFSATLKLDRLSKEDGDRSPAVAELLARVKNDVNEAVAASRSLAVELFPPALHESGLPAALAWLAGWMNEKYGLIVDLTVDERAAPAGKDIRTLVFESIRELLFNVVKHAKVERVAVDLTLTSDDTIRVTVTDTGVGFDPTAALNQATTYQGGLGLFSIRERLALLGGTLEVESTPGLGTRFLLIAPRLAVERRLSRAARVLSAEPAG